MAQLMKKYIKKAAKTSKKNIFSRAWKLQKRAKRKQKNRRSKKRTKRKIKRRTVSSRKRSAKKVRKKMGKNSVLDLGKIKIHKSDIMQTIGAAASGTIGGFVNQATNGRLAGNGAQVAAGLALGYVGGRNGKNIGKGILMKAGADVIEDNIIPQIFGQLGGMAKQSATATADNVF